MPIPTPEQLAAFADAPTQLSAALTGLDNVQIHFAPVEGEWSINEIIVHLADAEVFYYERMRKTIAEDTPNISSFDENAFASRLSYSTQSFGLGLALFAALRNSSAALLAILPPEAWERACNHPERGVMTLYDLFAAISGHSSAHLEQIEHLKQTM